MAEQDNPGRVIWHVACDESGIDGQRFYGFGSLWMKYQRRGDFAKLIRDVREKHGFFQEIKWQKANSKKFLPFHTDLIELFSNINGSRFTVLSLKNLWSIKAFIMVTMI